MNFDFTIPITWADIISVVSTLVALAAVIVAIIANFKASKSLEYSLKMQEQSKNIDLFEKRVAIIDELKKDGKPSSLHLELLFDDYILREYNAMLKLSSDLSSAYHDLNVYSDIIEHMDGDGDYTSPIAEIMHIEQEIKALESPDDKMLFNYNSLCNKYQITYSESGESEDEKLYNYKEITDRISYIEQEYQRQKNMLLCLMQDFVKKSISPIY